jgi:hypothetical protein
VGVLRSELRRRRRMVAVLPFEQEEWVGVVVRAQEV